MVVHGYYPGDPRVRREATAAADAGYDVDVICLRAGSEARRERVDRVGVRRVGLRHVAGGGGRRMIFEYLAFTALASLMLVPAALRRHYSVIHVHNPPDFLVLAGLLPRAGGARLILDVHDFSWLMFRTRFPGRLGRFGAPVLEMIERIACTVADVVLTVHEPYKRELIAHGVDEEKIVVVMNVFDEALLARLEPHMASAGGFVVAYCGTISPWHGVDLVLDALEELHAEILGARAVILGDGDLLPELQTRVANGDLNGSVELSGGWVPTERALGWIATASCGVIPNRATELTQLALSTKLFEYVALGLPVVAAELRTEAAHFGPDEVTFFSPGDPRSLASALRWVASHPEEAQAKTSRARERVARQYSWRENRERYLRALAGPGRASDG